MSSSPPANEGRRLLLMGGAQWSLVGRQKAPNGAARDDDDQDYDAPHIYMPAENHLIRSIHTHCTSAHFVYITVEGEAYTFGRNETGQLGNGTTVSTSIPQLVDRRAIGAQDTTFVSAATGRGHTLLLTVDGRVFAAGDNKALQLGFKSKQPTVPTFTHVAAASAVAGDRPLAAVACGSDFSVALVRGSGRVVTWGHPEFGQLGHGSDESYMPSAGKIIFQPQLPHVIATWAPLPADAGLPAPASADVDAAAPPNIVSVACGANHTLAVDDAGGLWVWGCAGFGRLGSGHSGISDLAVPAPVMTFRYRGDAGKIRAIAAGPTCSMATDAQGSLWLWGKWKNSGDGGSGTPWMQPRPYMGLSGWNISAIAMGLVTLFAIGDGGKAISWGQNASNGELGHGPDEPKSSTQAKLIPSLEGITAYALACGMRTSLILVSPDDPKVKQLPRTNVPESASVSAVKGATKPKATKASPESPAAGATAGQACEICEKTTSPKTNPLRVCGTCGQRCAHTKCTAATAPARGRGRPKAGSSLYVCTVCATASEAKAKAAEPAKVPSGRAARGAKRATASDAAATPTTKRRRG